MLQLPIATHAFTVYMDNFFTSIPLFRYLCSRGIGACGTVRTNFAMFPKELKIQNIKSLEWDALLGKD